MTLAGTDGAAQSRSLLAELPALCAGALGAVMDEGGFHPRRLPEWVLQRIGDPGMPLLAGMPAGVRLEMVTDAPWIELDVQLTLLEIEADLTIPVQAAFEALVDGVVAASAWCTVGNVLKIDPRSGAMDYSAGGPATVRLDGWPAAGERFIEVWLPHNAVVDILDVRVPAAAKVRPSETVRPSWAHYGSSISHCVNVLQPTLTWPAVVALRSGTALHHLGFGGQCHVDAAIGRLLRDSPIDALSLKLGINVLTDDTMRERTFVPAVHGLLDLVRDGHPDIPIMLVSPIFCAALEDAPGPIRVGETRSVETLPRPPELNAGALTGRRVRELLAEVVAQRSSSDPRLTFLDGTELIGPDDSDGLLDGLHPGEAATALLGERFFARAFGPGGPFHELVHVSVEGTPD